MSDLLLTAPSGDNQPPGSSTDGPHEESSQQPRDQARPRAKPRVASEEDCLAALSQIPSLLMLGLITPGKASVIRGIFSTLLQHYQRRAAGNNRTSFDQDELAEILRKQPELAASLEPLLTTELIEILLRQPGEKGHEGT